MPVRTTPAPKKDKVGPLAQRLTAQQELFVDALVTKSMSGKDAAIAAGTPAKSAAVQACNWLNQDKCPQVWAAIQKRREFLRHTSDVTAARIMQELARIGLFDPRRILKPDGKGVVDLKDMPDDVAAVISNINVTYGEDVDGDGNYHTLKHIRFQFHDKLSALSQLAGMMGLNNGGATTVINNNTMNQLVVKWDDLYKKAAALPQAVVEADPIEARILAEGGAAPPPPLPAHLNTPVPKGKLLLDGER